jgi:hypothetical protein
MNKETKVVTNVIGRLITPTPKELEMFEIHNTIDTCQKAKLEEAKNNWSIIMLLSTNSRSRKEDLLKRARREIHS